MTLLTLMTLMTLLLILFVGRTHLFEWMQAYGQRSETRHERHFLASKPADCIAVRGDHGQEDGEPTKGGSET